RRHARRLPAAAWPWPPSAARGDPCARQHLRPQEPGRALAPGRQRGGLDARGDRAAAHGDPRPDHRPHARPREHLLRRRPRGPRLSGRALLPHTLPVAGRWRRSEEAVSADMVVANVARNIATVRRALQELVPRVPAALEDACTSALAHAIQTAPEAINPDAVERLGLIYAKYA